MILSDGEIRNALNDGRIVIDPMEDEYLAVALTTSAIDLRLGTQLQFYRPLDEVIPLGVVGDRVIDPSRPGVIPDLITKCGRVETINGHFDLQPKVFTLGATLETITLPVDGGIAARVEGKSTLARLGFVVHMTAPTIHCGFSGNIVLEMYNFGDYPIRLTPGMRVCQLIFENLGQLPTVAQTTQYQGQQTAAG